MALPRQTQVLVAGAGPVGLTAALVLSELGVEVEVIDEEWRSSVHNYALALHPATLAVLDALGVAEALVAEGRRVRSIAFWEGGEQRAAVDLRALDGPFPFALVVPQSRLESALEARLRERGVRVHWDHRLAAFKDAGSQVTATVNRMERVSGGYAAATSLSAVNKTFSVRAGFLIGADGHHSVVRRQLRAAFDKIGEPHLFGVFELLGGTDSGDETRVVLDDDTSSALWPMGAERVRWTFELRDAAEMLGRSQTHRAVVQIGQRAYPQVARALLADLLAERAPWFGTTVEDITWSVAVRFEQRLANRLGHGHVWLAGDAAHLARPLGMHSMNVGIREARQLAEIAADVVRSASGTERLDRYGLDRGEEWRALLSGALGFRAAAGATAWVARRLARIPECIPASGAQLDTLLAQLGVERRPFSVAAEDRD